MGDEPDGIIPADAGNTTRWRKTKSLGKDHPRGCGEHCQTPTNPRYLLGSSPRMRGTPVIGHRFYLGVRIIPADAGNTSP